MKIIADTSPLIALAVLDKLTILQRIFSEICLPEAVFAELAIQNKVFVAKNRNLVQTLYERVDLGEAEAIVLALEMRIERILIDDAKGRKIVRQYGLRPIGTIGVLLQAKQNR